MTNGANASVSLSQQNLIDLHSHVMTPDTLTTTTNLSPGATMDYSFIVSVDPPDRTYFPVFAVSTDAYGSNAIHFPIKLKVDSTDVMGSISTKPDTFFQEKRTPRM
ncbi:MAG: hypothetical protein WCF90_01390 [Methanomicrobiales archaeon]